MPRRPIVIIGGGIGGLTLGRCLQHHGIAFTIYDQADGSSRHSYGITLRRPTYQPLLDVLQTNDHDFRRALAVDRVYHDRGGIPSASCAADLRANRSEFEAYLSKPIEQHIKRSHKFKSIRKPTVSEGGVEATFHDDMTVPAELVIDCSGVHSPLRKTLLPEKVLMAHPYVAINSKRYISKQKFEQIYSPELREANVMETKLEFKHKIHTIVARLEIAVNDHDLPGNRVSLSYIYSRHAFPDNMTDWGRDNLYQPDRPPEAAKEIHQQYFKELGSLRESSQLSPAFADAFNVSADSSDRLLNWLLRSIYLDEDDIARCWGRGVLLMGDAAFAEPIIGSVPGGANHVIGQAMRLADKLAGEWRSEKAMSDIDLAGCLDPKPKSGKEEIEAALSKLHSLEPSKATL